MRIVDGMSNKFVSGDVVSIVDDGVVEENVYRD
jgi:hypothetical protein